MAEVMLVNLVIYMINIIAFIFDIVTFPIYFLAQMPWKIYNLGAQPWATNISSFSTSSNSEVTFRSTGKKYYGKAQICKDLEENGVDTIDKMFTFIYSKFKDKECLGTREIQRVDEIKSFKTGKLQQYYKMGEYKWITYEQMFSRALNFGRGLRELGYESGTKVVIYAETRADWLIAAHGCFKFNFTLCTIYTNLGIDGVQHGGGDRGAGQS